MFRNQLATALNNMLRHKLHSLINIAGLAVGLASCLMISLFVRYEFSYDSFFPDAQSIYRISPDFAATSLGPERRPAANVAPLAPLLADRQLNGVADIARIGGMDVLVAREQQAFYEAGFRWADGSIFNLFEFDWLQGNPERALSEPDSVVLAESLARKYFGSEDPLSKTLLLENNWPLTVTGVFGDLPANSHLYAEMIVPMATAWKLLDFDYGNNWAYTNFHTYVRLQPQANIDSVMAQVNAAIAESADLIPEFFGINPQSFRLSAQRITDIHLYGRREGEFREQGNPSFVITFSAIAGCLVLIACINFMNLATARAVRRSKEVGMRKTLGASRLQLGLQFLGESLLMTLVALALAMILVELLLPVFAALIERQLASAQLAEPGFIAFIAGITLLTALVAGSYPALYLSAFQPAKVLKSEGAGSRSGLQFRNVLVMAQFFLAITLLVTTATIWLQMQYVRNLELGFNKDQILVLWGTNNEGMGRQWPALKQRLLQHPGIANVTEADMAPESAGSRQVRIEGGSPEGFDMLAKRVGFGFFETYEIGVVAGRTFDEVFSTDVFNPPANSAEGTPTGGSYILNEAALRELGVSPDEVLGRTFEIDFSNNFSLTVAGPVIGVVEDVHLQTLRQPIEPLAYFVPTPMWGGLPSFNRASVRLTGNDIPATIAYIESEWRRLVPEVPLIHRFLDTDYAALYQDEIRQGQLFSLFAVLTILIACLGLFGLASYSTERRRKEIGVRKVMGGSVWNIVLLLTNDFSKPVLLANLVAWPVAYIAMETWLENFAYRIDLTPMIFIGSGLIALCVAWVTVGGTAAKAASQKPVLALRYE